MPQTRFANDFGRCFRRKKEEFDLGDLKPGDHIAEESSWGLKTTFWHHAIVESVDIDARKINVIHFYHDMDPLLKWVSVCRNTFDFTAGRFYRVVYEENECYPAETVLERARARLGEKRYRPFSNNCEHFANECKTGEKKCHQIWTGIEMLAKSGTSKIPSVVREVFDTVVESSASIVRQPGIAEVAEEGFKLSTDLSVFIAAVIETVLLCKDYRVAKKKYDKGELTREEFCEVVVKRICAGICGILLSSLGFVLGAAVPVPILGCFTSFFGGLLGDFVGKKAGGKLGELLTPLFTEHLVRKKIKKSQ